MQKYKFSVHIHYICSKNILPMKNQENIKTSVKKRIPYLDFLKFFAIASVLLGHSVEQITGNDFWDNPIWSFIYTYHMPLFMLLCGYFFGSSLKLSFVELLRKKSVQLLIPSISAWVIMYVFVNLTGYNPNPAFVDLSWYGFMNTVWFLKCVFFCYLIGWVFIKILRNVWIAAISSTVLALFLPFCSIDSVNFLLPMFWAGYFCHRYQAWFEKYHKSFFIGSVIAFLVMLPAWSGHLTVYEIPIQFFDWQTLTWDFDNLYVTLYRLAIGMAGSFMFFLSAPWVYNAIKDCSFTPLLNRIGQCTLGLYWVQTFLLECVGLAIGLYVSTATTFFLGPIIALFELFLCYQTVKLIQKNSYTRLLFLGERL